MSDFKSLLSVFQDATGSAAAPSSNSRKSATSGSDNNHNSSNGDGASNSNSNNVDLESTNDPNFSSSIMKQRIERLLSIQQIRKSTNSSSKDGGSSDQPPNSSSSFHLAVCATIVDNFPHEQIWKNWMTSTNIDIPHANSISNDDNSSKNKETNTISCSAELYIHAKHPKQILNNPNASSFLKSKLLPFTHAPNWNDVRVIRAMLSLLQRALEDTRTTHVLFCTESCIPIVTLGEAAKSILLDEFCVWEEKKDDHDISAAATNNDGKKEGEIQQQSASQQQPKQPNWNKSYIHCYNQNSPQCTRFDEHNCWSTLSNAIPPSAIHKALPGWCLLSRKHAQLIFDLPEKQFGGMNLWPAFERVWAPEEVYFPTALALCGCIDDTNEVLKRSVTHSEWDTRASNHKDRAHPLTYDENFDYELVRRVRNENGALFMRKLKRELDWNVWEEIVIRRGKGRSNGGHNKRAAPSSSSTNMRSGYNDYNRDRDRGRSDYRERNDGRYHNDSSRNQYYRNGYNDRHDRDTDRRRSYDHGHSSKRQRWR